MRKKHRVNISWRTVWMVGMLRTAHRCSEKLKPKSRKAELLLIVENIL